MIGIASDLPHQPLTEAEGFTMIQREHAGSVILHGEQLMMHERSYINSMRRVGKRGSMLPIAFKRILCVTFVQSSGAWMRYRKRLNSMRRFLQFLSGQRSWPFSLVI